MAPSLITEGWRSFWHTMLSNDRHASHDSPYRSGSHVPLPQSRHAPLTSVATSALESRFDLNSPAGPDDNATAFRTNGRMSPNSPYSPGMRSALHRQSTDRSSARGSEEKQPATEIQMQSFADGLPPPPPVGHSWRRIDRWAEDHYEELFDNLGEGATLNDVNELEHELDCTLPIEVRESLMIHDGQERGGNPTGIVFGCMLLDCEEIVDEWKNWRLVNDHYLASRPEFLDSPQTPQIPVRAFAGPSSSSKPIIPNAQQQVANPLWRDELLNRQGSQPPNTVQKAYAHPAWIPLARDWGGNLIAVDLAPGPMGKWGQIILFGRDYDTKFVVARSWSAFLASLADDLTSGSKVRIDEETGMLSLKLFKNADPPYMEILRWRCDQKYGRRLRPADDKRRSRPASGLRINSDVGGAAPPFDSLSNASPYASPTASERERERGRSPHRLSAGNGKAPITVSPLRPHVSSPLARVTEEQGGSLVEGLEKLVSVDTPRASAEFVIVGNGEKENKKGRGSEDGVVIPSVGAVKGKGKEKDDAVDELKTVEI
ncbi:cell wall assembly and cell proliferation coordinating protein [Trichodelitschia bisporula]|uniref:Cell wall assembly and cell proliferation coordinating protein n=1 Tax=Trichodelitschia bisporula TaxID=703511 RepID=A0A6G1I8I9_9PEZI|nr:cell wall assembly and cell proliferation coordinating protein [Trichodelitschia bisporula]